MSRKGKAIKPKLGRPSKGGRQYNIKLTDEVAEFYRRIGEGNLTLGIERAAEGGRQATWKSPI
jgi:hypothetical protein